MTSALPWIVAALVIAPCTWYAASWFYKRKIAALRAQAKAVKQTAAEHADQARKQIAQLQSELAARPPMPAALRERRANAAAAAAAAAEAANAAEARRARAEELVSDDAFKPTAIANHGFSQTEIMR
jgi:hypothetical protein